MIGETGKTASEPRRPTRAQQRVATRTAILDATRDCLVEDGWGGLTTRNVAERAGVAQSTLMHHFETREALLIEAVTHLASRLADDALDEIDLAALRSPEQRAAGLDQAWRELSSPPALAAAQLWAAAWSEPELAAALRELEERLSGIFISTAVVLFPDFADDPRFLAFLDIGISLFRGLVMAIPVSGRDQVDARWRAMRPILLESAAQFLGEERP